MISSRNFYRMFSSHSVLIKFNLLCSNTFSDSNVSAKHDIIPSVAELSTVPGMFGDTFAYKLIVDPDLKELWQSASQFFFHSASNEGITFGKSRWQKT